MQVPVLNILGFRICIGHNKKSTVKSRRHHMWRLCYRNINNCRVHGRNWHHTCSLFSLAAKKPNTNSVGCELRVQFSSSLVTPSDSWTLTFCFSLSGSFTSVVCVMLVITFLPEYVRLYVAAVSSASIVTTPPLHLLKKWENTQSLCESGTKMLLALW